MIESEDPTQLYMLQVLECVKDFDKAMTTGVEIKTEEEKLEIIRSAVLEFKFVLVKNHISVEDVYFNQFLIDEKVVGGSKSDNFKQVGFFSSLYAIGACPNNIIRRIYATLDPQPMTSLGLVINPSVATVN